MSRTTVFPTDPAIANPIYEQARADAKARAAEQWSTENFNMWTTYNTVLNPDWIDPWFEHELGGIYNGPSTGPDDPAYEMTQNLYMIYCWLKYKNWHNYAITAFTAGTIQSSTMTGGLWQSMVHPYGTLIGFNANSITGNRTRGDWHIGTEIAQWTATAYDEYLEQDVSLTAAVGSWDAVRKYPIKMEAVSIDGRIYIRPEYPMTFNRSAAGSGYPGDTVGYGLVQWTNYTILPPKATLTGLQQSAGWWDGGRHWQLNLTFQLMIMEWERQQAMSGQSQTGSDYMGEWVDANATSAYIQKEINGQIVNIRYPQTCTWDFWKNDSPLQIFAQYAAQQYQISLTDWDLRHIMMDIFRVCYIHSSYVDFDFETKTQYIMNAIHYWENNGGWDVKDIPRPRDLPECELDRYHISTEMLLLILGRRKKHGERTILL